MSEKDTLPPLEAGDGGTGGIAMELQNTRTLDNLNAAFAGEARLTLLYRFCADQARREGQHVTAELFEQTARNEVAHAQLWFDLIHAAAPDTRACLADAAGLEHAEWSESYAAFARVAREEGFEDIARRFDLVAGIEAAHEQRYRQQLDALNAGGLTHVPGAEWICQRCGYHQQGDDVPQTCPVCGVGAGWFDKA